MFFVLLESGSLVSPGWLEALAALDTDPVNGLAGPSTNLAWNEQAAFPHGGSTPGEIARQQPRLRSAGRETRTLTLLHSLVISVTWFAAKWWRRSAGPMKATASAHVGDGL